MMQSEDDQWGCLSFNSYSSDKLADIAAKVSDEFNGDVKFNEESLQSIAENDEFEFSLICNDLDAEIFCDGQVRPIFPIFNRDLLDEHDLDNREGENEKSDRDLENSIRIPLKKLFIEEREAPSTSSSEADELETIPPGTYCVWKPKVVEPSPDRCKKSKSTGSGSKRWKLRDLLRRSNSDGKDSFVFLTAKKKEEKSEKRKNSAGKAKAKASPSPSVSSSPVHQAYYARNRATKGNETPKRKSYLPYRQDLVGFFTTVNSLGRTLPRF